jgi:hypothetical protein
MLKKVLIVVFSTLGILYLLIAIDFHLESGLTEALPYYSSTSLYLTLAWLTRFTLRHPVLEEPDDSIIVFRRRAMTLGILFVSLRVVRLARRTRRWCFGGKEPPWAGDIYSLLSYINFVGMIPTIAVMSASPEHFFARVPTNGTAYNSAYKTPLKLLTSFATLVALVIARLSPDVAGRLNLRLVIILAAPLVPLLMVFFAAVIRLLQFGFTPLWFRQTWRSAILVTTAILKYIFSWESYAALDARRYAWACLYFYTYSYVALAAIVAASFAAALAYDSPALGGAAFVLTGNRWLVYRYYLLLRLAREKEIVNP